MLCVNDATIYGDKIVPDYAVERCIDVEFSDD